MRQSFCCWEHVYGDILAVWNSAGSGWVWPVMSAARDGKVEANGDMVIRAMACDGQTHGDDLSRPVPAKLKAWMMRNEQDAAGKGTTLLSPSNR